MINKNSKQALKFILIVVLVVSLIYPDASPLVADAESYPNSSSEDQYEKSQPSEPSADTKSGLLGVEKENTDTGIEKEEHLGIIKGKIDIPKSVSKVKVNIYKKQDYKEAGADPEFSEEESNKIITAAAVQKDGTFKTGKLPSGEYRLNFVSEDENFDAAGYGLVSSDDDFAQDGVMTDKEDKDIKYIYAKDKHYFLYTSLDFSEQAYISFRIKEKPIEEDKRDEDKNIPVAEGDPKNKDAESKPDSDIKDAEKDYVGETASVNKPDPAPISVKALALIDKNRVAATTEQDGIIASLTGALVKAVSGSEWDFDTYYVGESDPHYVEKTDDFSLKYQMEFHASRDLKANTVEIRMPLSSFTKRDGTVIMPTDLAIPQGRPESPVSSTASQFNYYVDGNDLVFFNYGDIASGSNSAWQVMFKGLNVMDIKDGTTWNIPATAKVNINGAVETETPEPLKGKIDTSVKLTGVAKKPQTISGKNYGPGLYTRAQVESYVKTLPTEYANNFDNYVYVLWDTSVKGNATQPWNLLLKESPGNGGKVVGIRDNVTGTVTTDMDSGTGSYITATGSKTKTIDLSYSVVIAYPKDQVKEGTVVTNDISATLQPYDKVDPDQSSSANANWSYKNYRWEYGGNVLGVNKSTNAKKLDLKSSWLSVYEAYSASNKDKGDLSYDVTGKVRSYSLTHYTSGTAMGQRIPGTNVTSTTVDDVLYATSSSNAGNPVMLTFDDYYFNKVTVSVADTGYNVFEDAAADPEKAGDALIYVMNKGSSTWTLVKTVPWSPTMTYTLTDSELSGQPYRVKVVHDTVNYETTTTIKVNTVIRADSPVFKQLMADKPESITIMNIGGLYGAYNVNGNLDRYLYDPDSATNYGQYPQSLSGTTNSLYGGLIYRDQAAIKTTYLQETSKSDKTSKISNDVVNGRANVRYTLTASDGYNLYGSDGINDLINYKKDLVQPGRNEVMFYDLLPQGVEFDPSQPLYAGRTTDMNGPYTSEYRVWDSTQVKVSVDKVTSDYKGTGRTFVAFKVTYSGADSSYYTNNMQSWLEGWGVSFGAYYDWANEKLADSVPNISAFMPAVNDDRRLLGTPSQDNGTVPAGMETTYGDFGSDIDGDKNTDEKTVLYANNKISDSVLVASESKIEKLVRADQDTFSSYGKETAVQNTKGYTYSINIQNATGRIKDIVFFDRLENAAVDRAGVETGFDSTWWTGSFNGLQLKTLDDLGVKYTVYYNANRNAPVPKGNASPSTVLTSANGWIPSSSWTGSLSDVKAFAVDISKLQDGSDFILDPMDSVSIRVKMTAPANATADWAYNSASYYNFSMANNTGSTVASNTAKVKIDMPANLEIFKKLSGDVPDAVKDNKFEFTASRNGTPLRNVQYALYDFKDNGWVKDTAIHATDGSGKFSITSTQKAVFENIVGIKDVTVTETESPLWKSVSNTDDSKLTSDRIRTTTFTNTYQPMLYAGKVASYVPEGVDVSNDIFTFKLLSDGQPLADQDFYYVEKARTDGGIPTVLGKGKTDANGEFNLKAGQTIAISPGKAGVKYTLTEIAGAGPDDRWFTDTSSVAGTLNVKGSSATITNYYRYKNLLLNKTVTNQDPAKATQVFKFTVTDSDNNPVSGKEWVLLDNSGKETATKGALDQNGQLSYPLAGKTVKIKGLEAGKTYTVKEADPGALYTPLNDGKAVATMPKYGESKNVTITNDYNKRPLSVSKRVLYDPDNSGQSTAVKTKEFTMTVKVDGILLKDASYDLYEGGTKIGTGTTTADGSLKLKNGQTATFPDAGAKGASYEVTETPDDTFKQVYPTSNAAFTGTLSKSQNTAGFVNGEANQLLLGKNWVAAGDNATDTAIVNSMKGNWRMMVQFKLEVTSGGETYYYPKKDTIMTVINTVTGNLDTEYWGAGSEFNMGPWWQVIVPDLKVGDTYRLVETERSRQKVTQDANGNYVQIKQISPENYQPVTGTVGANPLASITNSIGHIPLNGSTISKEMAAGSDPVPQGSKLVWRVERYDGTNWLPASGISYVEFDGAGPVSKEMMTTGGDGLITLTKTANRFPYVRFTEDKVVVNTGGGNAGDLRAVEVPALSDKEWGILAAYRNERKYGLSAYSGNTIINSNKTSTYEIAKNVSGDISDSFTFILSYVTSTNTTINTSGDILTEAAGGISYTVYDQKSNAQVGEGVTSSKGEITIKGGQYVKIDLNNDSYWTVEEKVVKPYKIVALDVTGSNIKKLDDNLTLIHSETQLVAGPDYSVIKDDNGRVLDSTTKMPLNLISGDLVIPSYVIIDGELRKVTELSYMALRATSLNSIKLPDTLVTIGGYALYQSGLKAMPEIPKSVRFINTGAFSGNQDMTGNITIPDNVKLGSNVFAGNPLVGDTVNIGSGSNLDKFTFSNCPNIKVININAPPNSIPDAPWGAVNATVNWTGS